MIIEICVNNNVNQDKLLAEVKNFIVNQNIGGDKFLLCDKETRKEKAAEYVQNTLWSFHTTFIIDNLHKNILNNLSKNDRQRFAKSLQKIQIELCDDANPIIKAIVNIDEFMTNAIETDSYGHFLSSYDGEEYELNFAGETYYLYAN